MSRRKTTTKTTLKNSSLSSLNSVMQWRSWRLPTLEAALKRCSWSLVCSNKLWPHDTSRDELLLLEPANDDNVKIDRQNRPTSQLSVQMSLIEVGTQRRPLWRRWQLWRRRSATSRRDATAHRGAHAGRTSHRCRRHRHDCIASAAGRDQRDLADQFADFGTQSDRDFALDGVQISSSDPADADRIAGPCATVTARAYCRRLAFCATAAAADFAFDRRVAWRGRRAMPVARGCTGASRERIDGDRWCRRKRVSDDRLGRRQWSDKAKNVAPQWLDVTGRLQLDALSIFTKLVSATNRTSSR